MPLRNCSVERSAERATSASRAWRRASQAARLSASSEESADAARSFVSLRMVFICDSKDRAASARSEEHTSELQSHHDLVCRLLLEKKKNTKGVPVHLILIRRSRCWFSTG